MSRPAPSTLVSVMGLVGGWKGLQETEPLLVGCPASCAFGFAPSCKAPVSRAEPSLPLPVIPAAKSPLHAAVKQRTVAITRSKLLVVMSLQ